MNAPTGWHRVELGEAIRETQLGGNYNGSIFQSGVPMMKMGNMGRGRFLAEEFERLSSDADINSRDFLHPGDLILNTRNSLDLVGKVAMWRGELKQAVFNSNMMRLVPDEDLIASTSFLNYLLNSEPKLRQIRRRATGTTSVAAIYWRDLEAVTLLLPPPTEQKKIADILSAWDEALEKLDALIAAKDRRKKSLMQQLLTGKRRLPGFDAPWQSAPFDTVFERIVRKVPAQVDHVLSITAGIGFVDQREKFSRVIAGRNLENYVLLKKGEFSYNKGNSDRFPQGCVYRLEEFDEGAVPSVWISFRLRSDQYSSHFYKHFFLAGGHSHQLHRLINSGVRNDGLLNLTADNFFSIKVPMPAPEEQKELGELFEHLHTELRQLRQQRAALDQQKRGLMQRLLTGRVRVRP